MDNALIGLLLEKTKISEIVNPKGEAMKLEIHLQDGECIVLNGVVSYKPIGEEAMNFSEAVKAMKLGNKVRRLSWPEGHYIWMGKTCIQGWCGRTRELVNPTLDDFEATDWWLVIDEE